MKTQFTFIKLALAAVVLVSASTWKVDAAATLTAATGGSAISADTTTAAGGTSTYTTLTNPKLAEGASGDVSIGSIILNAPSGFNFKTTAGSVTVSVTGAAGANMVITNATGSSATAGGNVTVTPTATTITVWVKTVSSGGGHQCTLTWSGIQVVPTAGNPLASGIISDTGTATANGLTLSTANWGTLTEVGGAANTLTMNQQPSSSGTAGTAFATQPQVTVQDQFGNSVTNGTTVSAVEISGGVLQPTTGGITNSTTSSGVATFSGLYVTNVSASVTLRFWANGHSVDSSSINVGPGATSTLKVTTQPSSTGTAGTAFVTQPQVTARDQYGNLVVDGTTVTATQTSGGSLNATTTPQTANTSSGVAAYTGLYATNTGAITLTFTANSHSTNSTSITMSAGTAAQLAFNVQPSTEITNTVMTPAVTVQVLDQYGNLTTSSASVTVAIGANPGSGTLGGITTTNASIGTASFSTLSIDKAGQGYTLTASSGILTGATSSSFDITPIGQRGTATSNNGTTTTLAITKPTGVVAGDVMIANFMSAGNNPSVPASLAGWTLIRSIDVENGGGHHAATLLYRVADGTEGSSFTFNLGASATKGAGEIIAYSGVDTTGGFISNGVSGGPFDVAPGIYSTNNAGSTAVSATAITTASAEAAVILLVSAKDSATSVGSYSTTSPGSLTDAGSFVSANGTIGAGWGTKATAGSTGAGTATLGTAKSWGALLLALKPGSAPTNSATAIASSANPALPGASVTFTATVTGAGGTPTGTVQFKTNGVNFGVPVALSGGSATSIAVSTLPHLTTTSVTAVYSGDTSFAGSTSSTLTQTIDTPPASGLHYLTTTNNVTLVVSASTLAGLDFDADGDALTITAVSSPSTNGFTVTLSGGNITYVPTGGYVGADQFTYTISDGFTGGTATCTNKVSVTLGKASSVFNYISGSSGTVNLRGYGIPGHTYDVQRSSDPTFATGVTTLTPTQTAAANGVITFQDTGAPNPSFYRFVVH